MKEEQDIKGDKKEMEAEEAAQGEKPQEEGGRI